MKKKSIVFLFIAAFLSLCLSGCEGDLYDFSGGSYWTAGFASEEIPIPETDAPLYIAGYNQGVEITGVRDLSRASALWLDTGDGGVLLIGIDCIGLSSGTVKEIRDGLKAFCKKANCRAVNVYATHDHESVDTLGLWGPVGIGGKNPDYQKNLIQAAVSAGEKAYENRTEGTLYYGSVEAGEYLKDSRNPQIYDTLLHQFRFVPKSGGAGIRVILYGAHAESMRSDNTLVSRDYPGVLCDKIKEVTGDDALYIPGAIGGLIMTKELAKGTAFEERNVVMTGEALAEKALSIKPEKETELKPRLRFGTQEIRVPLDNPIFMYYQFLGVIDYNLSPSYGDTGYSVITSVSLLVLDDTALALLPCELFPEFYLGEALSSSDPEPIVEMAREAGVSRVLVGGLCNNELGYVMPPSYFVLNPELPFLDTYKDISGEDHYEETNSVGVHTAERVLGGLKALFRKLK